MIVAIDGPAGSGKSTIAKEIARQLGFNKLDTGAMYRAVTFAALDRGIDLDDEAAIDTLAEQIEIRFTNGTGEDTRLTIDGKDASAAIRTPQVDANVSKVSAYPGVRAAMLVHQRRAAEDRDIVAEGRDIGTVVFPNAQVKVFLTADPRERARRRVLQRHQNDAQPLTSEQLEAEVDETLDALKQRDKLDSSREVAPLVPAEDAVHVDSTAHTIDEVVHIIEDLINQRRKPMRLFKQTPEDYYNAPYAEFPVLIRGTVFVVMAILWAFSKLMWRWKVEDADLLFERQEGRGSVVICNHTSMAELLAVETALFFGGRRIRPIFKSEFAKSEIVRWAFSRVGGIPVERGTADMKCLRAAQHALQRGEDVLIFPEGTRIRSREIKPEVHGGFALIAQMGKAPVNPLAICGWSDITPAGKKIMRPKKCWIRAGKAVSLSDAPAGLKRTERLAWFESEAMNRVYAMRDELCAEHPGRF